MTVISDTNTSRKPTALDAQFDFSVGARDTSTIPHQRMFVLFIPTRRLSVAGFSLYRNPLELAFLCLPSQLDGWPMTLLAVVL